MPTTQQLNELWASEFEFFGGLGHPKPIREVKEFTGECIGHFEIDPETNDLKIVVHGKQKGK